MDNQIQIFTHEQFGKIRVVIIDGEPWFVGKDVAIALGYSNSRDALSKHVPDKFKRVITRKQCQKTTSNIFDSNLMCGIQCLTFINEAGFYRLVLRSRMPKAEEFTDWVCEIVLSSIRRIGMYSIEQIIEKLLNSTSNTETIRKCIYALEMSNATIKIGCTQDFERRRRQIETSSGLTVVDDFHNDTFDKEFAYALERYCHQKFEGDRIIGEFFNVPFDEACVAIKEFVNNALPTVSDFECRKLLAAFALTINELSKNLIADKND